MKDASRLYEVERRDCYAARPGFRIVELQIGPAQRVPWHYHNEVRDTFYVLEGSIRIFLQDPKQDVELTPAGADPADFADALRGALTTYRGHPAAAATIMQ